MVKKALEKDPKKPGHAPAAGNTEPVFQLMPDQIKAILLSLGSPFTKTHLVAALKDSFELTQSKSRKLADSILEDRYVRKGPANRYTPELKATEYIALIASKRSGFMVAVAPGREEVRVDSSNVLLGDRVFGRCVNGEVFKPTILVERSQREFVCKHSDISLRQARPLGLTFENCSIRLEAPSRALSGKIFKVKIRDEDCQPFSPVRIVNGIVTGVVGDDDEAGVQTQALIERYGIPYEFGSKALEEAAALPEDVDSSAEIASRVDLRDVAFVTIDGADARDFDDAVYCEPCEDGRWRLLVAIADVSHYVKPLSCLDCDAQQRGTSVYFPNRVVPMLPEKLSNGLCSLNPDVDRAALVCDMVIGKDGKTAAYQFYPALIHSHARLTYDCVWDAINGNAAELFERGGAIRDIANLYALFKVLRKAREARGALDFESIETQIICDETDGHIVAIRPREHNDAHRLIEECMLAANVCAADFIRRNRAKGIFRVHDEPEAKRLTSLRQALKALGLYLEGGDAPKSCHYEKVIEAAQNHPAKSVINQLLLRSMQRAVYSPAVAPHYGLGYALYTHFTSPIRRYPDLMVHRTIRAILEGCRYEPQHAFEPSAAFRLSLEMMRTRSQNEGKGNPVVKKGDAAWASLAEIASMTERRADEASRGMVTWLKCRYMEKFEGKRFKGVITGANPAGVYVTLSNIFVEGFVHVSNLGYEYYNYDKSDMSFEAEFSDETYKIGDAVEVTVLSADPEMLRIDFQMRKNFTQAERRKNSKGKKKCRNRWS